MGVVPRRAITFKTNLTCGDRCFKHTDNQTSITEAARQADIITEIMSRNKRIIILKYKQTSASVVIRYFYKEEGPVVSFCEEPSHEHSIKTTLCSKSHHF